MNKKFLMMVLVSLFTVVAVCSCNKDDDEKKEPISVEVMEVALNKTAITLFVDSSETLTAVVVPDSATDKIVTWTTSDASKVTVIGGTITAVAEGTATITAIAGGKSNTCHVTVVASGANTLTVVVGSSFNEKIDFVEVVGWDNRAVKYVVASAPYSNGGFTLNLPETVSNTYLEEGFRTYGGNMSSSDVKVGRVSIYAYKSGNVIGYFYHGTADWTGRLIYSTEKVNVKDSHIFNINWSLGQEGSSFTGEPYSKVIEKSDIHLEKGWNMIYSKDTVKKGTREQEETTTIPSDAKWYFHD
ncbi:MAG: Ig-like domain-containing protein [Prevotellaceae bacterium]|jgi:hypothetical protein|nr:Ig-like domain-containing protein [Prevotellaceae bacterium]